MTYATDGPPSLHGLSDLPNGEFVTVGDHEYQVTLLRDGADNVSVPNHVSPTIVIVGGPSPEAYVIDTVAELDDVTYRLFRDHEPNGRHPYREPIGVVTHEPIFLGENNQEFAALRRLGTNLVVINTSREGTRVLTRTET